MGVEAAGPHDQILDIYAHAIEGLTANNDYEDGDTQVHNVLSIALSDEYGVPSLALTGIRQTTHVIEHDWISRNRVEHITYRLEGQISADGLQLEQKRAQSYDEYKSALAASATNQYTAVSALGELLKACDDDATAALADEAISRSRFEVPTTYSSSYTSSLVFGFSRAGKLGILIDRAKLAYEAGIPWSPQVVKALNIEVRLRYRSNDFDGQIRADRLLASLEENGLILTDELNDAQTMIEPKVARLLAPMTEEQDIFAKIPGLGRRTMANAFIEGILTRAGSGEDVDYPNGRNEHNATRIKQTLYGSDTYRKVLSPQNIITLANQFTQRINQSRPADRRQELLPATGDPALVLSNVGEAVFRILEMTATKPEHTVQNRDYAELVDAMLAREHQWLSQRVTIADICARYPDAQQDLVVQLQDDVQKKGYAAASRRYKNRRKAY